MAGIIFTDIFRQIWAADADTNTASQSAPVPRTTAFYDNLDYDKLDTGDEFGLRQIRHKM